MVYRTKSIIENGPFLYMQRHLQNSSKFFIARCTFYGGASKFKLVQRSMQPLSVKQLQILFLTWNEHAHELFFYLVQRFEFPIKMPNENFGLMRIENIKWTITNLSYDSNNDVYWEIQGSVAKYYNQEELVPLCCERIAQRNWLYIVSTLILSLLSQFREWFVWWWQLNSSLPKIKAILSRLHSKWRGHTSL